VKWDALSGESYKSVKATGLQRKPQLITLLEAASKGRNNLRLTDFSEVAIDWAVDTGLGPLLYQATKAHPEAFSAQAWTLLKSADLTAKITTPELHDAMAEITDACRGCVDALTLLKGISICHLYPQPHLRPMRDLDVLVAVDDLPILESLLLKLGYIQKSENPPEFYERHHHSMPFFHPEKRVWVEVHRQIFPSATAVASDWVFSPQNVATQLRPLKFQARRVNCLSDELCLVYIASHWASDLKVIAGMIGMLDAIHLLRNRAIDWKLLLTWVRGSIASTHLYLLLTYLDHYGLIDVSPEILHQLFLQQRSFGRLNLRIVHTLIDYHLVEGNHFESEFSRRNLAILWQFLLLQGRPSRNLTLALWNLAPALQRTNTCQSTQGH